MECRTGGEVEEGKHGDLMNTKTLSENVIWKLANIKLPQRP